MNVLLWVVWSSMSWTAHASNGVAPTPIPIQSGGVIIFGQSGVLHFGPDGLSMIVPDQRPAVAAPAPQFEAAGVAATAAAPTPVICECHCPPCPSPEASPEFESSLEEAAEGVPVETSAPSASNDTTGK